MVAHLYVHYSRVESSLLMFLHSDLDAQLKFIFVTF